MSLSKPHTSKTALCTCVYNYYIFACLRLYAINFKWFKFYEDQAHALGLYRAIAIVHTDLATWGETEVEACMTTEPLVCATTDHQWQAAHGQYNFNMDSHDSIRWGPFINATHNHQISYIQLMILVHASVATITGLAEEMDAICWHMWYLAISGEDSST